jgi:hypothetical protein
MGQPNSLVFSDKGLSTVITGSNRDANGTWLSQDQISSVNKIRYYDKLSDSKNHFRNLKNAFAVMAATKDKLRLTDPVMERSAYYYRKTLDSKLIKGIFFPMKICHQPTIRLHLRHRSSILEPLIPNLIELKSIIPRLQLHFSSSLVHRIHFLHIIWKT